MIEKARLIVSELPESCRKHLQITCYAEHFTQCFRSGSGGNDIAIQTNGDLIIVSTVKKTWQEFLKSVFMHNWKSFVGIILHIAGNLISLLGWNDGGVVQFARGTINQLSIRNVENMEYENDAFYEVV